MKRKELGVFILGLCSFALASCSGNGTTETTTPDENTETTTEQANTTTEKPQVFTTLPSVTATGTTSGEYGLADNVQDGAILHAWNWSYNTIKKNLKTIAESGYSAVQTSPVQQSKSIANTGAWTSEWAKLYQPVAFHVAENSYLGTKEELGELCTEAKKYGIHIICDIVVNHMGNDEKGTQGSYSSRIAEEEPELWANREKYFHQLWVNVTDQDAKTVTQYQLSCLPDLNTGSEYVQGKVTDLLKECIDLGVTGFRFDAAKHIETPDDGDVASNFWPNVLGAANSYAEGKGFSLFAYGEVLNTPGGGRKIDSYTKYMSITDTKYSSKISGSLSSFANAQFADNLKYTWSDGTKSVAWAESHDTYADKSSMGTSQEKLNRIYAVELSHSGAAALFFARPNSSTAMGDMGTTAWKSAEISAVNNFHNAYMGKEETVSCQNGIYMNERGKDAAILVSATTVSKEKAVTIEVGALADGTYYDQVTGNEWKVENKTATGKMGTSGIVVLDKKVAVISPEITISSSTDYYYGQVTEEKMDSVTVLVNLNHYESASYTINGGEPVEITSRSTRITVSTNDPVAKVVVTAKNSMREATEEYTLTKIEYREGYAACGGLKAADSVKYFAWVWINGGNGKWIDVEVVGDIAYVPFPDLTEYNNYLLVSFAKDMTLDSLKALKDPWASKLGQTADFNVREGGYTVEKSSI